MSVRGAAKTAQTRRALLDEARRVIHWRGPAAVHTAVTLLVLAHEHSTPAQRHLLRREYEERYATAGGGPR